MRTAREDNGQFSRSSANQSDSVAELGSQTLHDAQELYKTANALRSNVQRMRGEVQGQVLNIAKQNPYVALAAAAGTGFVVGGGLSFAMTRRLWAVGGRLVLSLAMQRLLNGGSSQA